MNVVEFAKEHGLGYHTVRNQMIQGYCKWPQHKCGQRQKHPLYKTYLGIRSRTTCLSNVNFKYYGGRGIKMCPQWYVSFEQFVRDIEGLGPKPEGHSLDRINNDGNYEPGNVRWASRQEQARNSRRVLEASNIETTPHGFRVRVYRNGLVQSKRTKTLEEAIAVLTVLKESV